MIDLGMQLNRDDPLAFWSLIPAQAFELHNRTGQIYWPSSDVRDLSRPYAESTLRRGQTSRGQLLFRDAPTSGAYTLVLPLASGPIRIDLPAMKSAHLARPISPFKPRTPEPSAKAGPAEDTHPRAPTGAQRGQERNVRTRSPVPTQTVEARCTISGIPDVLDTGTLTIAGRVILLYGVRGANEPHTTNLKGYLADREVRCMPVGEDRYRCLLGDIDLSESILHNGAGWATSDAPEDLKSAEQHARENKVGVWENL